MRHRSNYRWTTFCLVAFSAVPVAAQQAVQLQPIPSSAVHPHQPANVHLPVAMPVQPVGHQMPAFSQSYPNQQPVQYVANHPSSHIRPQPHLQATPMHHTVQHHYPAHSQAAAQRPKGRLPEFSGLHALGRYLGYGWTRGGYHAPRNGQLQFVQSRHPAAAYPSQRLTHIYQPKPATVMPRVRGGQLPSPAPALPQLPNPTATTQVPADSQPPALSTDESAQAQDESLENLPAPRDMRSDDDANILLEASPSDARDPLNTTIEPNSLSTLPADAGANNAPKPVLGEAEIPSAATDSSPFRFEGETAPPSRDADLLLDDESDSLLDNSQLNEDADLLLLEGEALWRSPTRRTPPAVSGGVIRQPQNVRPAGSASHPNIAARPRPTPNRYQSSWVPRQRR